MKNTLTVVAALIWQDGKILIGQRPASKKRANYWEFVGGKVEVGETKQQALVRECQEELAVTVTVGEEFFHVTHEYDDVIVDLTIFHAQIAEGTPTQKEHQNLQWIAPREVDNFTFCPADETVLQHIKTTFCD